MITRLVKLTIDPDKIKDFEDIFIANKDQIARYPGCLSLKVFKDINRSNVYFTYSTWKSEEDINNYKGSELFGSIWPNAKKTFCDKPEAWSLTE